MSKINPIFSAMTDIDNSIITDAKKPRKGSKALIIAAVAAAAAGIVIFAGNYNSVNPISGIATADKPAPPAEIPSGNYYINGNPTNDELYLVVDGGNIRFANKDNNVRDGFEKVELEYNPALADDSVSLKAQLDQDMADWGDDYDYALRYYPGDSDKLFVYFRMADNSDPNQVVSGQTITYIPETKTLTGWAGDFILAE